MYSIDSLLATLSRHPGAVLAYLAALPAATALLGWLLRRVSPRAAAAFAAFPTHVAVLQGVSLLLVLGYAVFMRRQNLLTLNVVVYYLPVASAAATLWISGAVAPFDQQPGFGRLEGLCALAALAFGAFFVLDRLHFFAGVFIPLASLGGLFLLLCAVFNFGVKRLKGEPPPPTAPPGAEDRL